MVFLKSESGAALVEYAVALIIVTLVGGMGVLAIGSETRTISSNASTVVSDAVSESSNG